MIKAQQGKTSGFVLPVDKRWDFAWPRGLVVKGPLSKHLTGTLTPLICVGDVVSSYCKDMDINHIVLVVDGKTRRTDKVGFSVGNDFNKIIIKNPPGSVSLQAITTLCELAHRPGRYIVIVEGEEDMLALAAISCLPGKGTVVYGVPGVGATIIRASIYQVREAQSRFLELKPSLISIS